PRGPHLSLWLRGGWSDQHSRGAMMNDSGEFAGWRAPVSRVPIRAGEASRPPWQPLRQGRRQFPRSTHSTGPTTTGPLAQDEPLMASVPVGCRVRKEWGRGSARAPLALPPVWSLAIDGDTKTRYE